jgi:acyl-CoA reductase-like NAD-dependent aldehyde dehydrogenase
LIPDSDTQDIDNATNAALEAYDGWSKTSIEKRSQIMLKIADLIEKNLDRLTVITAVLFSFFTLLLTFLLA